MTVPKVDWMEAAGFVFILGACLGGLGRAPVVIPISVAGLCVISLPKYWSMRAEAEKAGKGGAVGWTMAASVLNGAVAVFAGYGAGTLIRLVWF